MSLTSSLLAQTKPVNFSWSELPRIPDPIGFAGSFVGVSNGALIVAGGANFPDGGAPWTGSLKVWTAKIFVLESVKGAWKQVGTLPERLGYGASVNWKNKLILIGGSNEVKHSDEVTLIDYKDGKISTSPLPKLPFTIANTSAALIGDVIYVFGGIRTASSKTAESNFWALDLAKKEKEWKILPSLNGPSRMLNVAASLNEYFYVISGVQLIDGQRTYLKDAYKFHPKTGWERIADLPSSVAAAAGPAFVKGNYLAVFGGDDGELAAKATELKANHPGFSKQILSYNSSTNTWDSAGEIITKKNNNSAQNPNGSVWAPVTTSLTVWKGNIILPGGEVRPATRTPRVLVAKPNY